MTLLIVVLFYLAVILKFCAYGTLTYGLYRGIMNAFDHYFTDTDSEDKMWQRVGACILCAISLVILVIIVESNSVI